MDKFLLFLFFRLDGAEDGGGGGREGEKGGGKRQPRLQAGVQALSTMDAAAEEDEEEGDEDEEEPGESLTVPNGGDVGGCK